VGAATAGAAALVGAQVVGKAVRDTLFIGTFGVEKLPLAMIGGAFLSGLLVLLVSRGAATRTATRVATVSLCLSAALLVGAWLLPSAGTTAILAYVQTGVLSAASVSVFWSIVSACFDPFLAHAAVPRITAGATLGGALGALVTWGGAAYLAPRDLLLLVAALNLAALATIRRLGRHTGRAPSTEPLAWRSFAHELPYLRAVAVVVLLAALTQALLDYQLSAAAVHTLGRGQALLSFFALFYTTVGVVAFLLQVGVSRAVLERFGVGVALALAPVLLVAGAALPLVLPSLIAAVLLRASTACSAARFIAWRTKCFSRRSTPAKGGRSNRFSMSASIASARCSAAV
jgi:hypothetical protein